MNDFIAQLEAELTTDEYGRLRQRLACNDDALIEALVTLRRVKKLTQPQVAERMGRSKTAVSNFERLGGDPRLSTIRRYAAAVGALIDSEVSDYDLVRHELGGVRVEYSEPATLETTSPEEAPANTWELAPA